MGGRARGRVADTVPAYRDVYFPPVIYQLSFTPRSTTGARTHTGIVPTRKSVPTVDPAPGPLALETPFISLRIRPPS